ncbi:hypothetical protein AY610_07380 [Bacillus velezensis]|nr:hypothetical protein AY610_07380 [Bacillus velezensis]
MFTCFRFPARYILTMIQAEILIEFEQRMQKISNRKQHIPAEKMCKIEVYFLKKGKDICTTKREMNISGKE